MLCYGPVLWPRNLEKPRMPETPPRPSFLEAVRRGIVIGDGAMGTMLYQRGIFLNRCFDELCLSSAGLVEDIHRAYMQAGSEILTTNTFGANRFKLQPYGLEDRVTEINRRGAELARRVADGRAYVLGSMGPTGVQLKPLGHTDPDEVAPVFREQVEGLVAGGADVLAFETFHSLEELAVGIRAARSVCDLPIIASASFDRHGLTNAGVQPGEVVEVAESEGASVVGCNCSTGPNDLLDVVEQMASQTRLPIVVQPNAGLPRTVEDRLIFLATPEYMAEHARRFILAGASMVGGCCGTTPEHIKEIQKFVAQLKPMKAARLEVAPTEGAPAPRFEPTPTVEKTPFAAKLREKFVVSVEIDPPRGIDPGKALAAARRLTMAGVDVINIADGPRASARMSPFALATLMQKDGIEPIVHYCCRDRNLLGMQADLIGLNAVGLQNVLIITGDPPKMGDYPDATAVFDVDAIGLTRFASRLNVGLDMANKDLGAKTALHVGVGANPGAVELDLEVERFCYKVSAGAEYCLTQPVYDVALLERFLERARPISIPILVGILPLVSHRNAEFLHNEVPGMQIPGAIRQRMRLASERSKEAAAAEGLAIAREALVQAAAISEIRGTYIMPPLGRYNAALGVLEVLGESWRAAGSR